MGWWSRFGLLGIRGAGRCWRWRWRIWMRGSLGWGEWCSCLCGFSWERPPRPFAEHSSAGLGFGPKLNRTAEGGPPHVGFAVPPMPEVGVGSLLKASVTELARVLRLRNAFTA